MIDSLIVIDEAHTPPSDGCRESRIYLTVGTALSVFGVLIGFLFGFLFGFITATRRKSSTNEVIAEENPAYGVTLGPAPATTTEPLPTAPQPQEAEYELIPF
ncbi:hypothetical protein GBAR_LOCUS20487 [Geodia barretti]|uniref:Uncharacterized protein n=1 Tax=Geodia barretti TaxID=519541 RepID=A0AA35X1L3_GEOBA|nr:hypothetical protein GBAR_LOCUS20487 [Geodia barretti]